jgi:Domain of unknown function (DUF4465)
MTLKTSPRLAIATALIGLSITSASAVITFEDQLSSPGTFNNNAGASGAFTTGGVSFPNSYTVDPPYTFWSGFAMSNTTDITTAGFGNQYSAFPGGGAGGSSTYAVSYGTTAVKFTNSLNLNGLGASITNTTYAAISMRNGDKLEGPGKKFGGLLGTDADFFKLTMSGFAGGTATGTLVDFYLADFRSMDSSQDYIVNQWTFVDFSALGTVDEIRFSYTSTDNSIYNSVSYINTPTYFALDNFLAVPEPSAAVLAALGCLGLMSRRRR